MAASLVGVGVAAATDSASGYSVDGCAFSADIAFDYRPVGRDSWTRTDLRTLTSPDTFRESVSGLKGGTEYEFRATVPHVDITVVWDVSDTDGDLATVSITVHDGDSAVRKVSR